jgi:uncharacterized protein DUF6456
MPSRRFFPVPSQVPQGSRARMASARLPERPAPESIAFARSISQIATELGRANVVVNEAESPLAWVARRRGRNGRALIEPYQLQAGERLRADFTRAHTMPRTTSNWADLVRPPRFRRTRRRRRRNGDRRAPARTSGARRGGAGIRRPLGRRLLFPKRPRGY